MEGAGDLRWFREVNITKICYRKLTTLRELILKKRKKKNIKFLVLKSEIIG